jgi:hypothetical protein
VNLTCKDGGTGGQKRGTTITAEIEERGRWLPMAAAGAALVRRGDGRTASARAAAAAASDDGRW